MGKSVNKVMLLGNVGKDPEIKATGGGTAVATFSLATTDRRKDNQGNWQDQTEWHNVVVYGRLAEIVRDYIKKGSKLYIEGKLQTLSWEDKSSGDKRHRTEVIGFDVVMLGGTGDANSNGNRQGSGSAASTRNSQSNTRQTTERDFNNYDTEISDDDIPF